MKPALKSTPALRITLVCNTAWAIYTYRQGLIRMLVGRGVDVTVLAPRDRTFELLAAMGCRCIELPVASKGTNPRDDLRTLYVTTARQKLSPAELASQPHAGALFALHVSTPGLPEPRFAGSV